jgi:zinc transporter, ZIP family
MLIFAFPHRFQAIFWGLVSGSALIVGALFGYYKKVSSRVIGMIMAFGSGVLISALAFELMDEAYKGGGFGAAATGFILGAIIYTGANYLLNRHGAKHRKRSGQQQAKEQEKPGSGRAIAIGALIDGLPESIAIGVSMTFGSAVSTATVVAIFLSNVPEALSSTSGMKKAGRSKKYIFGIWIIITLLSGLSSLAGYSLFSHFPPQIIAGIIAVAAGGILAMLSSTMIPEAYEDAHEFIGIITVLGFLAAFVLSKMGG